MKMVNRLQFRLCYVVVLHDTNTYIHTCARQFELNAICISNNRIDVRIVSLKEIQIQ